ncbi:MarR family transcriptional regulator (plasmid) [Kitasatospora sp. NBC_00070]|uniref:MarR family transcriptional regulator n=1 Tax=Kitasatospora sp. NBC_00070 TaxID=2975962 RepID=UPI002F914185
MSSTPAVLYTPTNCMGVVAELNLPVTAYRVLLMLMERQQPGGRIVMPQRRIGELLGIGRSSVTVALGALVTARLVLRPEGYKEYQLNAMLAGYASPGDAWDAIETMDEEDRLDDTAFVQRYKENQALQEHARADKRRRSILKVAG